MPILTNVLQTTRATLFALVRRHLKWTVSAHKRKKAAMVAVLFIMFAAWFYRYLMCSTFNLNGIEVPRYFLSSSHQLYALTDPILARYQQLMTDTASAFFRFAESHHMLCSIEAGVLIGLIWNARLIPWDDDYDIVCREKDWHYLDTLWANAKESHLTMLDLTSGSWGPRWDVRIVTINEGDEMFMMRYKLSPGPWYKFRPAALNKSLHNEGGIDIWQVSQTRHRIAGAPSCGPLNNETTQEYPWVAFHGTQFRAPRKKALDFCLDNQYGKMWRKQQHPRVKTGMCSKPLW